MTSTQRKLILEKKIEKLRKQMVTIATEKGYTSQESIQLSQELDEVINEYLNIKIEEKRMRL
ncbi:aspartyl-phosphate phosphatase Spo0E family protein [Bacillaceae bacterium W0354]